MTTKAQIDNFLRKIIPIAQRQARKHNGRIYASVCIAQAAHESGWGTSAKMVKANALFGIKVGKSAYHFGTAWKGAGYKTGTTEYYDGKNPTKITDWFRAYDNIEDATEDYFDMLCHCQRYRGALNQSTPQKCIEGIIKGGYATGPEYVKHIMYIINTYGLDRYDDWDAKYILTQESSPYATIKIGSRGKAVTKLQNLLNDKGYKLSVDGIFGVNTQKAVMDYQRKNSLMVDGIVGPKTWDKLLKR